MKTQPPTEKMCRDCHEDAPNDKEEEEGRGQGLVTKVRHGNQQLDHLVVRLAKVVHAVLQVAHVPKEILAQLLDGPDGRGGRQRRTPGRVPHALFAG